MDSVFDHLKKHYWQGVVSVWNDTIESQNPVHFLNIILCRSACLCERASWNQPFVMSQTNQHLNHDMIAER